MLRKKHCPQWTVFSPTRHKRCAAFVWILSTDDPLPLCVEEAEPSEQSVVIGETLPRDVARLRMSGLHRLTTKASLLAVQKCPKYGVEPTNRDALEQVGQRFTASNKELLS